MNILQTATLLKCKIGRCIDDENMWNSAKLNLDNEM